MVSRLKSISGLLGADPRRTAEKHLRDGDHASAEEVYAKAELWEEAAQVAAERRKAGNAALYLLRARLGEGARDYEGATANEMAEALSIAGHHRDAMAVYELTRSYGAAGKAAEAAGQIERAGRLFLKARRWHRAAACWRRLGRDIELLDALVRAASDLAARLYESPSDELRQEARLIDFERAALCKKLGRAQEAGVALARWSAESVDELRLMDGAVPDEKLVQMALEIGESEEAMRVLVRMERPPASLVAAVANQGTDASALVDKLVAQGSLEQAAQLLEGSEAFDSAAVLWERAENWSRAADRWQRAERFADAARCFENAGSPEAAAPLYCELADHRSAARCYLAMGSPWQAASSLFAAGAANEALVALMRVTQKDPHYAEATLSLMPVLVDEERQYAEAARRLRLVPKESRGVPDYWYWCGRAYEGAGKLSEARTAYDRATRLNQTYRDAAARLDALGGRMPTEPQPSESRSGAVAKATQTELSRPAVPSSTPGTPRSPDPEPRRGAVEPREGESLETDPTGLMSETVGGGFDASLGTLPIGKEIAGRYEIVDVLGRGGMGQVYKARDHDLDELVAIKTVLAGAKEGDDERLIREVQICRKITHPNVVRVYDIGRFEGGIFVTMELIEGLPLDLVVTLQQTPSRIKSILEQVTSGLAEAHRLQVVHRDLKPSNLLVTLDHVKIVDFGIAREQQAGQALQEAVAIGSPLYMSPEQLTCGPIDARSDLYALGVVAFLLITGREPFLGESYEAIARAHLREEPPSIESLRPDIPKGWSLIVERLLEKKPENRFQSAEQVLEALALVQV